MAVSLQAGGLVIDSLTGGMNNQDPPNAIDDDQCVLAENVEFWNSTLGERRGGCEPITLTDSGLDDEAVIVHMNTHLPLETLPQDAELWAVAATEDVSTTIARRVGLTWSQITPLDALTTSFPEVLKIHSASIHGKFYICYKSAVDRMHVWDGTNLRRTGVSIPAGAPIAVDAGGAGAFTDARTYRVRFAELDGDTVLRQSEPSDEYIFTPSGTNGGALVTRVVIPPGEGETHWILEASDGDGNFYQIATLELDVDTFLDTTNPATDYADVGELSENIGEYQVIPSYKFVKVDQDRLIFAHQWEDEEKGSRVAWTPVWKSPGHGNDERIPDNTDNYLDLDWMDGGNITDISDPLNGSFYVFKWNRTYKMQRTGNADSAYQAFLLSAAFGAIEGSVVSGVDEYGKGCVYFIDPSSGPMRVGANGIQTLNGLQGTWKLANTQAENIVAHGIYYPDKRQIHWWLATEGEDTPNIKIILQTTEVRSTGNIARRGWTTATGLIATAWCSTVVPQLVHDEDTDAVILFFIPHIGLVAPNGIQRCDVGSTDSGESYRARIVTKPFFVAGMLNKWGAMNAALLAAPLDDDELTLDVKFVRDFGRETNMVNTDFVPEANETSVIKVFDNLVMSDARAIQVEFSDPEE